MVSSNTKVALGVAAFALVMFSYPFVARKRADNMQFKEGNLTGSQRQRGMYLNHGSHDAGVYHHVYKSREQSYLDVNENPTKK